MANNLQAALKRAGLQPDELAEIVQVDPKTARRWLRGRTPYPRHRVKIARALDTTEHALWPEIPQPAKTPTPTGEIIAAYPSAQHPHAPDWQTMLNAAEEQIDLLGETLLHVLQRPRAREQLAASATRGCRIRIAIAAPRSIELASYDRLPERDPEQPDADLEPIQLSADPQDEEEEEDPPDNEDEDADPDDPFQRLRELIHEQHDHAYELLEALADEPNIQIRIYHHGARLNSILRFDEQMLVTLHLWGKDETAGPLLHLRRQEDGGLFDQFEEHLQRLFDAAETDEALFPTAIASPYPDSIDERPTTPAQPPADAPQAPADELTRPRRWPRRPAQ
jgi:transcriptional regulator with XRE-family HTH domain